MQKGRGGGCGKAIVSKEARTQPVQDLASGVGYRGLESIVSGWINSGRREEVTGVLAGGCGMAVSTQGRLEIPRKQGAAAVSRERRSVGERSYMKQLSNACHTFIPHASGNTFSNFSSITPKETLKVKLSLSCSRST